MAKIRGIDLHKAFCFVCLLCLLCIVSGRFSGGDIYDDRTILYQSDTYKINKTVNVHENATLTIEAGVQMVFVNNASLNVSGCLVANGTPTSRIVLSRVATNDTNIHTHESLWWSWSWVRLVDGNGYNKGRLEVFYRGVWGTVCDDGWTEINSLVVCRELGFIGGSFTGEFQGGTGPIWLDEVSCSPSDVSLSSCGHDGLQVHDCSHSEDVGLICTGGRHVMTFGNVSKHPSFITLTSNHVSSMSNVDIIELGHHDFNYSHTTAISCGNTCPVENVTITGFYTAIAMKIHDGAVLNDVKIENCFIGIAATDHSNGDYTAYEAVQSYVRLKRITICGCHLAIGTINRQHSNLEFDDISITDCYGGIFDLRIADFRSISSNETTSLLVNLTNINLNQCQNAIVLQAGLTVTVSYQLDNVHVVDCFKGILITKSIFSVVSILRSQVKAQHSAIDIRVAKWSDNFTRTTACGNGSYEDVTTVVVMDLNTQFSRCSKIFVAQPGHLLHLYLKQTHDDASVDLKIYDNSSLLDVLLDVQEDGSKRYAPSSTNKIIVEVNATSGELYIVSKPAASVKNIISQSVIHGAKSGIRISGIDLDVVEVQNCSISGTLANGILITGKSCAIELIDNVFEGNGAPATQAPHDSDFGRDTAVIRLSLETHGDCHMTGNDFRNNWKHLIHVVSCQNINISNNVFLNNSALELVSVGVDGRYSEIRKMLISRNKFFNNSGENIVDIVCTSSYDNITISGNVWQYNVAEESVTRLNVFESPTLNPTMFSFNILTGNLVNDQYQNNVTAKASIILHIRGNITFFKNIWENPGARYELTTRRHYGRVIDARFNWWGSKDSCYVFNRICLSISIYPFLTSHNTSDTLFTDLKYFPCLKNSEIGGPVITNITLGKDNSPYLVTKDILIYPGATLTISSGVRINVLPGLGFDVDGRLEILGEEHDRVSFSVGHVGDNKVNNSAYPLRLVPSASHRPWEGVVEVLYNNTWGSICADAWTSTNGDILCKQLGYQGFVKTINGKHSSLFWLRNINCRAGVHNDISGCPSERWGVQCLSQTALAVRCDPGYWRGIMFRHSAKQSQLKHARFERAGSSYPGTSAAYNFVLQFDILRQTIYNIEINDFAANGIKVITGEPDLVLRNISISENTWNGVGIKCFAPSCTCFGCNISNVKSDGMIVSSRLNELAIDFRTYFRPNIDTIASSTMVRKFCDVGETVINEESSTLLLVESSDNYDCIFTLRLAAQATVTIVRDGHSNCRMSINDGNKTYDLWNDDGYAFTTGPGLLNIGTRYCYKSKFYLLVFTTRDTRQRRLQRQQQVMQIENSTFTKCQSLGIGVEIGSYRPLYHVEKMLIRNTIIRENKIGLSVDIRFSPAVFSDMVIDRCSFRENNGTALRLNNEANYDRSIWSNISILHSSFHRNGQCISLYVKLHYVNVDVPDQIVIIGNTFTRNTRTILRADFIDYYAYYSSVDVSHVIIFKENLLLENMISDSMNGLLEITGSKRSFIIIAQNTMSRNKCRFVGKYSHSRLGRFGINYLNNINNTLQYINNTIVGNEGVRGNLTETPYTNISSFTLGLFSCLLVNYNIHNNSFNNQGMDVEIFVGHSCGTYVDADEERIDAEYNWWGVTHVHEIKNRIFDFGRWNDRLKVNVLPAASSKYFSDFWTMTSEPKISSIIGGYLTSSTRLTVSHSPYVVRSDLTVARYAKLTIEAGVQLHFQPRVGILVLGGIVVNGKADQPVKLCSLSKKCSVTQKRTIRVTGGSRKFYGNLEVFVGRTWEALCSDRFNLQDAKVACRQLGNGEPLQYYGGYHGRTLLHVSLNCQGHENYLSDCPNTTLLRTCSNGGVYLECSNTESWGNIRVLHSAATLRHVVIDDSGALHMDENVPTVQLNNGSLQIEHAIITNGNGIEVFSRQSSVELDNVTINGVYTYPALSIFANVFSVKVSRTTVANSKYGGMVVTGEVKDIKTFNNHIGFPNLCSSSVTISVSAPTYIYLPGTRVTQSFVRCDKILHSPSDTTMRIKMAWIAADASIYLGIYDGDTTSSRRLLSHWLESNQDNNFVITSTSNLLYLVERIYYRNLPTGGALLDVFVVNKTGSIVRDEERSSLTVVESKFHTSDGPAIRYFSDLASSTNVTITRCQFSSLGRDGNGTQPSIEISANNRDHVEISNNLITKSFHSGIVIHARSNQVRGSIVNNVMTSNINGSSIILLDGQNSEFLVSGNYLKRNVLNYQSDLISINNVWATINNNTILDNEARYALRWEHGAGSFNHASCLNNVFYLNKGYLYATILVKGIRKTFQNNFFVNPANDFEVVLASDSIMTGDMNVTRNWWGDTQSAAIYKKIKYKRFSPARPLVIYEPYLKNRDLFYPGSCPLGWTSVDNKCFFYQAAAQTKNDSEDICKQHGGVLMKVCDEQSYMSTLDKILKNWRFNRKEMITWIRKGNCEVSQDKSSCITIRPDGNNSPPSPPLLGPGIKLPGTSSICEHSTNEIEQTLWKELLNSCWVYAENRFVKESCDSLYPSICEKLSETVCFYGRISNNKDCVCFKGWKGQDCSLYHCNDVGDCSYGSCVGPNNCKCRPGWMGRGCTVSYCPAFVNCRSCLSRRGCGWCEETAKCLPGTAFDTDIGQCGSWFYYHCISVGGNAQCSNNVIMTIDCESRLCDTVSSDSTLETCQQCRDLEKCYKNTTEMTSVLSAPACFSWNETRCPKGSVRKDYNDRSRVENIMPSSSIKVVLSDKAILYSCPAREHVIIIMKYHDLELNVGDTISSSQAEGIFNKIIEIRYLENYMVLLTTISNLDEVVSYIDISQEIPLTRLVNHESDLMDCPDESLLFNTLSGNVTLNESKIHVIQNDINVFKCLGHEYSKENETVTTFYVVLPETSFGGKLQVGDVIAGNNSDGFLEEVVETNYEGVDSVFVHTKLLSCSGKSAKGSSSYVRLSNNEHDCVGGDDLLGLRVLDDGDAANVVVDSIIVGRESGSFLGKVVSFYKDNGKIFVELSTVIAIEDGKAKTTFNNFTEERLHTRRRRKRALQISPSTTFLLERNVKVNDFIMFGGRISFTPKTEVTLDVSLSEIKSLGIVLTGDMDVDVCLSSNNWNSFDYEGPTNLRHKKPINNKVVGLFCIPIPMLGCIPGNFVFDVTFAVKVKAEAEASVSARIESSYFIRAGGIWRRGYGVQRVFEKNGNTPSFSYDAHTEKKQTVTSSITMTPTFKVQWPALSVRKNRRPLPPKKFQALFDLVATKVNSNQPIMQLSISAPATAKVEASFCSELCQDSGKNIDVTFSGGLPKLSGILHLNLGWLRKSWELFSINLYEKYTRECLVNPTKKPCCYVNSEKSRPGKINPENNDCEEECTCTVDQHSVKGIKASNGSCECDTCPDGSLKLKRGSEKPNCPCFCADGSEREMIADQSCPCECTCLNGSTDIIASDGSCPCECSCQGYQETARIGRFGCQCQDKCPVCTDGQEPVWIEKKCVCRERKDCGVPPVCATGRKGPSCEQPDCGACGGCSWQGVCVTTSSCRSWCRCNRRWEGTCCERRRPIRTWGDPHLQTLDGFEFDYFGIGEFWDCKSVANDFGTQTRYFAFNGASLTGAVALKAGDSIVTITTSSQASPSQPPKLRIDGRTLDNLLDEKRISLANETITLDVFKPKNNTNGTLVVILAFQYKTGVTVSVEVAYSPVMKRQYLNIQFAPVASFLQETEGLCGFMDDNIANDLIGPNGEQYNDSFAFAESWRINTSHHGSGLQGSWSWNSSNFHIDDVMDESYTTKKHTPRKALHDLPKEQVAKARSICSSKGLEGNMLTSCIFDISVTNDTSFSEQQSLQIGCPNECTGKGLCSNGTCSCLEGWSSEDCSVGICGNCSRGKCVEGFCQCEIGWEGSSCDKMATCFGVGNCTSKLHGKCQTTDKCLCSPGYIGLNCSIEALCYDVQNCSSHGTCVGVNVCQCDLGWNGAECAGYSCESLGRCSGNGQCIAFDVCECFSGWTGASCSIPECAALAHCSRNGECVGPNECRCFDGFQGDSCNATLDCSLHANCSGNGWCLLDNQLISTCSCFTGFTGSNCSTYDCLSVDDCSGHGTCREPNLCLCDPGYEGRKCVDFSCEKLNRCSGHGTCIGFDQCKCDVGWSSETCGSPVCHDLNNCSFNGICVSPNKCKCYDDYDGENCTDKIEVNVNAPAFNHDTYNVSISENRKRGDHVLTVFANDSDSGRSGQVSYSVIEDSFANYFILDRKNGHIAVVSDNALDYEQLLGGSLVFTIRATDDGLPSKSSQVTLTIMVIDENDNCPIFETLPGNYELPLNIVARDADSGRNGEIDYIIDDDSDMGKNFHIPKNDNRLVIKKVLPPGKYPLKIIARDRGEIPCARELLIDVFVRTTHTPTSSSIMTMTTITSAIVTPSWLETSSIDQTASSDKTTGTTTSDMVTPSLQTIISSAVSQDVWKYSSISTLALTTLSQNLASSSINADISKISSATVVASSSSKTISPENLQIFAITIRLINQVFRPSLQDKTSTSYKTLESEVEKILTDVWRKFDGFRRVTVISFEQGSIVAKVEATFTKTTEQVKSDDLVRAIIANTDDHGRITTLQFDVAFLKDSLTTEPKDDGISKLVWIVPISVVAVLALVAIIGCSIYRSKRKRTGKEAARTQPPVELRSYENRFYDIDE